MIETRAAKKQAEMPQDGTADSGLIEPDWLLLHTKDLSPELRATWSFAYQEVHTRNRYQRGERPAQALSRLKGYGMLADLSVDGLQDMARELVKSDLGPDGGKNRNHYTVNDRILDLDAEKLEVFALVARKKKHLEALRICPTTEQVESIFTAEYAEELKKCGLEHVGKSFCDALVRRLDEDRFLNLAALSERKVVPVGVLYIASGAATVKQVEEVLIKQRTMRDSKQREPQIIALKASGAEEYQSYWKGFVAETGLGNLLRAHLKENAKQLAKLAAAEALILKVQAL